MANSFAESITLTCAGCGQEFEAEFWLIVDAAERPDLVERIRAGSLHDLACPHCGDAGHIDAPLLLYRPDGEPAVLFSPAERTSAEEDSEQAYHLLDLLRGNLGAAWQEEWVTAGIPGVRCVMMPAVLSDDPQAALRQMAERATAEMEWLRQEDPERYRELEQSMQRTAEAAITLLPIMQQFMEASTWAGSRHIVEQHPELLANEADALLGNLIEAARAQGDADAVRVFEEHRELLRRCREEDVARAFAEKVLSPEALAQAEAEGIAPEDLLAMAEAADQMPAELAASGVELRSPTGLETTLTTRHDLRTRLKAAMRGMPGSELEISRWLQQEFEGLLRLQQEAASVPQLWPDVVAGWNRFLERTDVAAAPLLQANGRGNLANAYLRLYEVTGDDSWALQADEAFGGLLSVFTQGEYPNLWATTQHSLGNLYYRRYERSGDGAHARQADQHHQAALEVRRREVAPAQWAMSQHSLGALYLSRYERSGDEAHARQADRHYRAALEEYRQEVAPARWATVQHSLGNLYYRRYERSGDDADARQADQHYRAALEEYRHEIAPTQWAMSQHMLGALYYRRYERSGDDAHARQADQHYRAALEEHRQEVAPAQWATVQHSLGNLYFRRYERSGDDAHARQADQHYWAALEVRRREVAPADWCNGPLRNTAWAPCT